jgi:Fe-S cluster assembly ATPase SufC
MVDGSLVYEGDASLVAKVNESGYDEFIAMKKA